MKAGKQSGRAKGKGRKMHILVVSQYFHPESFRINDMAREWVERGYKVTVLTGIPNYPSGKFFEGYGIRKRRREAWNGVDIIRIPLVPRGSSGSRLEKNIRLAVNYLSFAASGWLWNLAADVQADLVFTFEVSPMTQALAGVWHAKKHGIPHFLYVQDLWPENVEEVAGIKSRALLYPVSRMVDYIYKNTDRIFAPSRSFAEAIAGRSAEAGRKKIHYWPQYAEEFYRPLEREAVRRGAKAGSPVHLIPDDGAFYVAFTGNIGTAQGLGILAKAAERLEKLRPERPVRFVIVGDGRCREDFEKEIKKRKAGGSFIMIPRQDAEEIPKILACCDAAVLSFAGSRLWEMTIPAKLQSYMACGMPVIAAAKGETERIIREAACGACCGTGDAAGLAERILELAALPEEEIKKLGDNARRYCESHYDKGSLMDRMDRYLKAGGSSIV